jgi:hypothetical protein
LKPTGALLAHFLILFSYPSNADDSGAVAAAQASASSMNTAYGGGGE